MFQRHVQYCGNIVDNNSVFQIIICMYIFMPIFDSCLPIILFGGEEGREEEESLTP